MRWVFVLIILVPVMAAAAVWQNWVEVPAPWDPWAPLDVTAKWTPVTHYKLWRVDQDAGACRAALASAGVTFTEADASGGGRCPTAGLLRVTQTPVDLGRPVLASCPLTVAFAVFIHHSLQPEAQAQLGSPVVEVSHYGTYACRTIAGSSRMSEHAAANALDIAGFRLADGRSVSVRGDWSDDGPKGAFLRAIHAGACRVFDVVLGPDANADHTDHFHVDMGPFSACR